MLSPSPVCQHLHRSDTPASIASQSARCPRHDSWCRGSGVRRLFFSLDLYPRCLPMPGMQFPLVLATLCMSLWKLAASLNADPIARSAKIQQGELEELATKAEAAISELGTHTEVVPGARCPCTSRAYAASCPTGWAEDASGQCQPPAQYKGLCSKALSFVGEPKRVKQEAEGVCAICWPCL